MWVLVFMGKKVFLLWSVWRLSMQNWGWDGIQKQTVDGENEGSDDWMLCEEKWLFEGEYGKYILCGKYLCLSQLRNIYCWTEMRVYLMLFRLCSWLHMFQQSILKQAFKLVFCFWLGWWDFGGRLVGFFLLFCCVFYFKLLSSVDENKSKLCIKWCTGQSCDMFRNCSLFSLSRFWQLKMPLGECLLCSSRYRN